MFSLVLPNSGILCACVQLKVARNIFAVFSTTARKFYTDV